MAFIRDDIQGGRRPRGRTVRVKVVRSRVGAHGSAMPTRAKEPDIFSSAKAAAARGASGVNTRVHTIPGNHPGLVEPGNINLYKRPVVHNPDGSISTVRSVSFTLDNGNEVLVPTVVGKRVVSDQQALSHYRKTGQHLGVFDSIASANRYADALHQQQAQLYGSAIGSHPRRAQHPDPLAAERAFHAQQMQRVNALDKYYRRAGMPPKAGGGPLSDLETLGRVALGLVGTTPEQVGYAVQHPIGRLENKGPFTVPKGQPLGAPAVMFGPIGRAAKAARILGEGERAARVARGAKRATVALNGHTAELPAADNRISHALEQLVNRNRDTLAKSGMVKSSAAKVGEHAGRVAHTRSVLLTAPAEALKKVSKRLRDPEQYALRILSEHSAAGNPVSIGARAAFHEAKVGEATDPLESVYHAAHASLIKKSSKFLDEHPNGSITLKSTAPRRLKQAWTHLQQVAHGREDLYRQLGLLTDQQIAERVQAPGRVLLGARWAQDEQLINNTLEANPIRQQVHDVIDQTLPPEQAPIAKAQLDAVVRRYAEQQAVDAHLAGQSFDPVTKVDEFFNHIAGATTEAPTASSLADRAGISELYQTAPAAVHVPDVAGADIAKRVLAAGHTLPKGVSEQDFANAIDNVMELVKEGAPYRDWYARGAAVIKDAAKRLGVPVKRMLSLVAVTSQGANPTFNLQLAAKAAKEFAETGAVKDTRYIFKQHEAEDALRGIVPETAKRNSYYGNFLHELNPKQFAKEFGSRTDPVTVDRHVTRMFLPSTSSPGKYYGTIEAAFQEIAKDLGWSAKEVQAAAWVPWKARGLAESAAKRAATKGAGLVDVSHERFLGTAADAYEKGHAENIGTLYQVARENPPPELEAAAQEARTPEGGFTLHRDFAPDTGKDGFVVALAPYEERVAGATVSAQQIADYAARHEAVLARDPSLRIGGWHNPEDGLLYFDVSRVVPTREEALAFGREQGQLSIFDRAAAAKGDWENAFPKTGLSPAEADAIKAAHSAQLTRSSVRAGLRESTQFSGEGTAHSDITLPQRAHTGTWGEPEVQSHGDVKGAVTFSGDQALIHAVEGKADISTWIHETGHVVRRYGLTPAMEDKAARWAEAEPVKKFAGMGANGKKRFVFSHWNWTREAEEKFARGLEQWFREGNGPAPLKQVWKNAAKHMREVYDHAELPDVNPDMRRVFERLYEFNRQKGGRLVGAEDFHFGVNYAAYVRGSPIALSDAAKISGAYVRKLTQLFSGKTIAKGPDDALLHHSFTGYLLQTGAFKADVTGAAVENMMTAARLFNAHAVREALLPFSAELPTSPLDIPIKVDPSKNITEEMKAVQDRFASVARGEHQIGRKEIDQLEPDLAERLRLEVFPNQIEGEDVASVVHDLLTGVREPLENYRWIPSETIEHSGILHVPAAAKAQEVGLLKAAKAGKAVGTIALDAFTDLQRAAIIYMNPAYVGANLAGNLFMNLMHQGWAMPYRLWQAALIHRDLDPLERNAIDRLMGSGHFTNVGVQMRSRPLKAFNLLGHYEGLVVDLIPRRASFLHEAAKAGYGDLKSVKDLIGRGIAGDEQAVNDLEVIRTKAADAIVDYERGHTLEKQYVSRWLFIYPWLRGATRYSVKMAVNKPITTMALGVMADRSYEQSNQEFGPRPYYAMFDTPISTESLGVQVPFTDAKIGLDALVGRHEYMSSTGLPERISPRQLLTQTTPIELAADLAGTASGNVERLGDIGQLIAPGPALAVESAIGYDPSTHKELTGGFARNFAGLTKENVTAWNTLDRINSADPTNRRKVYPRSKREAETQAVLSGLAPAPYNKRAAQAQLKGHVAKTGQQTENEWVAKTQKQLGMKLPPEAIAAAHTKALYMDAEKALKHHNGTKGLSEREQLDLKLKILAATHPEYASVVGNLQASSDKDMATRLEVNRWVESKLGWPILTMYGSEAKKLQTARAEARG